MKTTSKSLLIGFGLGVLFTSFLGGAVVSKQGALSKQSKQNPILTDEQILKKAKQLGMVDPNEFMTSNEENKQAQQANIKQEVPKREEKKEPKMIKIHIRYADRSAEIAQQMQEKGLVKKAEEFNTLALQKGLTQKMRTGEYYIPEGTSIEEILRRITTPPPFSKR